MISRITLAAAAGLLLGAAVTPAQAADLGGGCCADLEERVAELEATTARKGNRVVTLQVYGTVAKGLLIWDDGVDSDAYVVDNDAITSVVGLRGEAAIKPGLKAGYKIELSMTDTTSGLVSQLDDEGDPGILIRHNHVYIESSQFGRFTIGQQSSASDGAAQVSLANSLLVGSPDHSPAFFVRDSSGADINPLTDLTVGEFASDLDLGRDDLIRYDSPSIYGFIVSASWGDDDFYDVALRFAKEFNSIKIAAAIAYADDDTDDGGFEQVIGSISVMHTPTGLYGNFAAGEREHDTGLESSYYYVQAGVERKWFSYGSTTVYGEYGSYDDITVEDTNAEMWGFGAVQRFDSAALDLFAQARFFEFEDGDADLEDVSTVMIGAKIDF